MLLVSIEALSTREAHVSQGVGDMHTVLICRCGKAPVCFFFACVWRRSEAEPLANDDAGPVLKRPPARRLAAPPPLFFSVHHGPSQDFSSAAPVLLRIPTHPPHAAAAPPALCTAVASKKKDVPEQQRAFAIKPVLEQSTRSFRKVMGTLYRARRDFLGVVVVAELRGDKEGGFGSAK